MQKPLQLGRGRRDGREVLHTTRYHAIIIWSQSPRVWNQHARPESEYLLRWDCYQDIRVHLHCDTCIYLSTAHKFAAAQRSVFNTIAGTCHWLKIPTTQTHVNLPRQWAFVATIAQLGTRQHQSRPPQGLIRPLQPPQIRIDSGPLRFIQDNKKRRFQSSHKSWVWSRLNWDQGIRFELMLRSRRVRNSMPRHDAGTGWDQE